MVWGESKAPPPRFRQNRTAPFISTRSGRPLPKRPTVSKSGCASDRAGIPPLTARSGWTDRLDGRNEVYPNSSGGRSWVALPS